MKHLVLDSTEIYKDLFLRDWHAQLLLGTASAGGVAIHVPQVVVMECSRHYSDRVQAALDKMARAETSLRDLNFEPINRTSRRPSLREIQEGYESKLRKIVESSGGSILPLPEPSHVELLRPGDG